VSKEIWLGPVLGNNRASLLARCREYVARGETDRLLYIAASHPLLDLVTDKLLDGKQSPGVWGEFPVYLFRGFVRRVLSEARPSGRATCDTEPSLTVGRLTENLTARTPIDREDFPLRRSLISQIIKQLAAAGKLRAIKPLVNRDGCVNTIASLLGELQRAGKTPEEFRDAIESRSIESKSQVSSLKSQGDFDREVALIYSAYTDVLDKHSLTDEDADPLRALQVLRGECDVAQVVNLRSGSVKKAEPQVNNLRYSIPWLKQIDLLVLDGFFDFTPVQGEILRLLIPIIPNVIVNLNHDPRNEDVFRPFQSTIDHLQSIAPFETVTRNESNVAVEKLRPLREGLFNTNARGATEVAQVANLRSADSTPTNDSQINNLRYTLVECSDRELEIRSIAKEIKRLVLADGYRLSDIALVVRERASYGETIARVLNDESIPCNLERRFEATHVPAVRACGKLFQLLREPREHVTNPKASDLAHLIKTGYFRPTREHLEDLARTFDESYSSLLGTADGESTAEKLRSRLGVGVWRPDDFENAIAYVGSELRAKAWIDRAHKLIKVFPSPEAAQALMVGDEAEDPAATAADEAPPEDGAAMDRRKKPSPIHPAAIAWSILLMKHLQQLLSAMPEADAPEELRRALKVLLAELQFSKQIDYAFRSGAGDIPQATLDVRGRESLRRAIAAAVRSFEYAQAIVSADRPARNRTAPSLTVGLLARIALPSFIDEVERSLESQTLTIGAANRDGLRVLEATDVRGLRFRAIFVAGMIEGGFPLRTSGDWLYPHEERLRLQKHGIFLEDISTETLLKEEHYFYQAACRATERLYLTRPLALSDGTETVASYYIDELRRAIRPAQIEARQIRGDIDGHELLDASKPSELATLLIRQNESRPRQSHTLRFSRPVLDELLRRAADRHDISPSALRRVQIERARNSNSFGAYDGEITHPDLREMVRRHFGPEQVYSASGLSTYGNCAFRFLANRVLKIEPRNEAALDLQAIDAGKLLHDILRRFFEKHRGDYLPSKDREELRLEMARTADTVFKEHEDKVPPLNERIWNIDCEIRKLILDQVLLYELRLQEKCNARGMRPHFFELAFGRQSTDSDPNSTTDYLRIKRPGNGEAAQVQGQIDRVDVSDDRETVIAYDYKLSRGAKLDDIKSGRELQLPIYLAALEQLFVSGAELAGGGYYILRGGSNRLNRGLYRASQADCTNVTWAKGLLDDVEWQRVRRELAGRIWEFIDGMRGGQFRVKPSQGKITCKFCDYSAVCRYDTYRINRKN
jgi:ATP-dependent helicase/nuclease subunit B